MRGVIMTDSVLSIDIGGTFIKFGLVDSNGTLLDKGKIASPQNYEEFLENIYGLHKKMGIYSVGATVAIPGGYDYKAGKAFAPNMTLINGRNLKADLEKIIGIKIMVENDANIAALGEYVFVEKKSIRDMVFITLGTGVGGGMILNGKLFSKDVTLFEVGHMAVATGGRQCGCGRRGCLDEYCSVCGLQAVYEDLTGIKNAEPKEIGELAEKKNANAVKTFEEYGSILANAALNIANIIAPDKIKLGGGLSELSKYFMPTCLEEFEKDLFPLYKGRVSLEIAGLKNDAGLMGGAALFFDL